MKKRFDEVDQNFKTVAFSKDGLSYYNIDNEPFSIHGVYRDGEKYRRLPEERKFVKLPIGGFLPYKNTTGL